MAQRTNLYKMEQQYKEAEERRINQLTEISSLKISVKTADKEKDKALEMMKE